MKIRPPLMKRDKYSEGEFKCESDDNDSIFFFSPSRSIPYDTLPVFKGNVLYYRNLLLSNNGYYYCYGKTIKYNRNFWAVARLKVYGKRVETQS